ncbi:MAG: acetate/propionate family kinase [Nitrospirota bacterium]
MRVLVVNCGSSSVKFRLFQVEETQAGPDPAAPKELVRGAVSGIGGQACLELATQREAPSRSTRTAADHQDAMAWILEHIERDTVQAAGHRVVHGGERFHAPTVIDDEVIAEIERLGELAPLHNPACLAGIKAARRHFGRSMPMVAVFDTAFHCGLPAEAVAYAIPQDLASRHRIRRYGFHGIAHASLAAGYAAFTDKPLAQARLITVHLGNGCSAAAVRGGRSVDTSMGFTPLEGLVMGTRSGDLDPAIVAYLARREGAAPDEVERWLNARSGLLGLSGLSHDMRELLRAEQNGNPRAALAIRTFCHRARKYIGAYLAVLGGADALVFGGGIGENAPAIRARICEGMAWCGIELDQARNEAVQGLAAGATAPISREDSRLPCYVVGVDEETEIARETVRCLLSR